MRRCSYLSFKAQYFERSDAIKMHDRIIFDFYMELPLSTLHVRDAFMRQLYKCRFFAQFVSFRVLVSCFQQCEIGAEARVLTPILFLSNFACL